jgi:hypothetical protein
MADARNHLTVPIAQLAPWDFWARARSLDLSVEDSAAIDAGTATAEQQERAALAARAARHRIIQMPCGVPQPRVN